MNNRHVPLNRITHTFDANLTIQWSYLHLSVVIL